MAIKYLNNISLELNELQNFKVDPKAAEPTGVLAQMYYNTTTDTLRIYKSTGWADVSGSGGMTSWTLAGDGGTPQTISDGNTATFAGGTYITTSAGATDTITITHDNTTRSDSTSSSSPGYGGTFTAVDSVTTNATGHLTAINVKTVTIPASDNTNTTYDLTTAPTGTSIRLVGSDATNDDVTISGTTNEVEVTRISGTELRVGLPNDVTVTGQLTVSGTGQSSFGGQVTIPLTPTASTDAASKGYVDSAVTGALNYQGGYNASTNTPNLDTTSNIAITKGWTYTVTADGLFFTEQVRVGDVIIANQDIPANDATNQLSYFTTVQNNVDLASLTTVGIGNVNASSVNDELGIAVAYSSGTASVGVDIVGQTPHTTLDKGDSFLIYDSVASTNKRAAMSAVSSFISNTFTFSGTIGNGSATSIQLLNSGATAPNINHGLGTDSSGFMVQLVEVSTGETVMSDVTRGASGAVTIDFATAPATNDIRVLIYNIG